MHNLTQAFSGALLAAALLTPAATAQTDRVIIGGMPTNMLADWSQVVTVPDPQLPNTFVALMPLSSLSTWAVWEPDFNMDFAFGPGNWSRLSMSAVNWAYLSPDACAHQPAVGATTPFSLLTTDYDYGPYGQQPGTPLFPDATVFTGTFESTVSGLQGSSFNLERWQLRTRGFFPQELWNACPGSSSVLPNFTGFIAVRFSYAIL